MIIHHRDKDVVKWAIDQGHTYEYAREYGLPEPCLRVHLGVSVAFFHAGRLVRWRADAEGGQMDQLMCELTSLFGLCAAVRAYPRQEAFVSPVEMAVLHR